MGFIILGFLMGVAAAVVYSLVTYQSSKAIPKPGKVGAFLLGGLILGLLFSTFRVIPAGFVGVKDLFGSISPVPLKAGLHMVNPLVNLRMMDIRLHEVTEVADVPSQEGLTIHLDVSMWYRLEASDAPTVYRTIGMDYAEKIIAPSFRSAIRNATTKHEAKALYTGARELIATEVQDTLRPQLIGKGVVMDTVMLRKISLPERVTEAINMKLAAEQEAERMKFVLQKERQEAERKTIEAQGISDFQRIVSQGITPTLLEWKGIEATMKLAESPNSKIIVVGNTKNGLPLIFSGDK
jgi:regulator of protease activity HflC (stomatin/prohibitin superfamily)